MKATSKPRLLQELANAVLGSYKALLPNPEYQRGGAKWTTAQKQALIDSLLRGYHIPLIYIHVEQRESSLGDKNVYRWIIDGQQRLKLIGVLILAGVGGGNREKSGHKTRARLHASPVNISQHAQQQSVNLR